MEEKKRLSEQAMEQGSGILRLAPTWAVSYTHLIRYTLVAGFSSVVMILTALLIRSAGVLLCTVKTELSWKERMFCVIAYLPKATVQAAIGAVPLAAGLPCGKRCV